MVLFNEWDLLFYFVHDTALMRIDNVIRCEIVQGVEKRVKVEPYVDRLKPMFQILKSSVNIDVALL